MAYSTEDSDCTLLDAATGEVRANEVDIATARACTLKVTVSKTGYTPETRDISIGLEAGQLSGITWGDFTGALTVGGDTQRPTPTVLAGADVVYSTEDSDCTLLDAVTGEVRANEVELTMAPTCTLQVTVSKTGYTPETQEISIGLEAGRLEGIAWGDFTGALTVGGNTRRPTKRGKFP